MIKKYNSNRYGTCIVEMSAHLEHFIWKSIIIIRYKVIVEKTKVLACYKEAHSSLNRITNSPGLGSGQRVSR